MAGIPRAAADVTVERPGLPPAADTGEDNLNSELMTINMGPQHPSTHGVLRLVAKVDITFFDTFQQKG